MTQPLAGQESFTPTTFQLRERSDKLRDALASGFDPGRVVAWKDGWRLALEGGVAVIPLVNDMLAKESNVKARLLWIGALALACAGTTDDSLARLAAPPRRVEERVFAGFAAALAAASGSKESWARTFGDGDDEAVVIALALANARHPQRLVVPQLQRLCAGEDAALAAAAFAAAAADGLPAIGTIDRWWKDRARDPAAHLVRRACFLNDALRGPEVASFALATVVGASAADAPAAAASAVAAAVWLSRHGDLDKLGKELGKVPPPPCLIALASERRVRALLAEKGWLTAVPTLLAPAESRRVLGVLYAATVPLERVRDEAAKWQADEGTAGPTTLALALRAFAARASGQPVAPLDAFGGTSCERAWGGLAFRGVSTMAEPCTDAELDRALRMALAGKLPALGCAQAIEAALSRSGAHPGALRAEAWRLLVRDLLLAGSKHGNQRYGHGAKVVPLPRGIPADKEDFFEVACELWDFVSTRVPELSPGSGLR